jgi:uncharacterized membrane protein YbhN (UPF0104 family)
LLAFEPDLGYDAGILVLVTTTLSLVIPSLPAGIGVFEAALLVGMGPYGVDDSLALLYAVVLHALNFVPYVVAGYIVLHGHTRRLRRAAQELALVSHMGGGCSRGSARSTWCSSSRRA